MGMYEIESLVQESIETINVSKNENIDKRNLIWNLYHNIQDNFDCGYTHFRVIDILLKYSFTYQINITEHPDYKEHKKYFKEIEQKGKDTFVLKKPTQEWNRKDNTYTCFYKSDENKLYFDYGSLLWERLIKRNNDKSPIKLEVFEIGLLIMREAKNIGEIQLIYEWFGFVMNFYDWFHNNRSFEENKKMYLIEMKDIYLQSGANKNVMEHHRSLHVHNKEELKRIAIYFDDKLLKIFEWFIA